MIKELTINLKKNLDNFLEFDSDEIFKICDYCELYGGFVRDSISGIEPRDADFLCMTKSAKRLEKLLLHNGYKYLEETYPSSFNSQYKEFRIINEPRTFINKNLKMVQIIRPALERPDDFNTFYKILQNVDLSCCGVSYNGVIIRENCDDAILHCLSRTFLIYKDHKMFNENNIFKRIHKLENKGFEKLNLKSQNYLEWEKRLRRSEKLQFI